MFKFPPLRRALAHLAVAATVLVAGTLVATDYADARVGRGGSMGSRGMNTYSKPAPTPTAPTAQPMQRSATQPGTAAPSAAAPAAAARGGFFSRPGFMGGLMGGLLGAGIFGMLMGSGFFSGLGSLSGILGLLLQVGLIFIVVRLVMGWLRSRNQQPSYAGGPRPSPSQPDAANGNAARPEPMQRSAMDGASSPNTAAAGGTSARAFGFGSAPRGRPLKLQALDFDAFEQLLTQVQTAYGKADRTTLERLLTPEMSGYLNQELDELANDGLENQLSDVKLLQGDLSEAWSEGAVEYATVAMRYELKDVMVETATGRLVQGDADRATQATELWTFTRMTGGEWKLSAIQQA